MSRIQRLFVGIVLIGVALIVWCVVRNEGLDVEPEAVWRMSAHEENMRPQQRTVEVKEKALWPLEMAEVTHEVIEVVRETNAGGEVTFTTPGMSATVRKTAGKPIATQGDALFAAFVIECKGDHEGKHLLGVFHPRLGMRIQPDEPLAGDLDETFDMCWQPGELLVKTAGTPVPGARVSLFVERVENGETAVYALGSNQFYTLVWSIPLSTYVGGAPTGEWITNGAGYLRQGNAWSGALEEIRLPRYPGNTMGTDLPGAKIWDGSPDRESADYMESLCAWYKCHKVTLAEGADVSVETDDWCQVAVSGDADAWVYLTHFDHRSGQPYSFIRTVHLDGSGQGSCELPPGRFVCDHVYAAYGSAGATDYVCPRQWLDIEPGQLTASVGMAGLEANPEWVIAYCYWYGAEPLPAEAGCHYCGTAMNEWYAVDIGGDGRVDATGLPGPTPKFMTNSAKYGFGISTGPTGPQMIVTGGYLYVVAQYAAPLSGVWWDGSTIDENLMFEFGAKGPSVTESDGDWPGYDSEIVEMKAEFGHVFSSVGLPRLKALNDPWDPSTWHTAENYHWDVTTVDGDEIAIRREISGWGSGVDEQLKTCGEPLVAVIGGKAAGDITHAFSDAQIGERVGENELPEAARVGLERGGYHPLIALKVTQTQDGRTSRTGAMLGNVCPYCLGPLWRWPTQSAGFWVNGYCENCSGKFVQFYAMDARTFYRTAPATPAESGIEVSNWSPDCKKTYVADLEHWYRQVEYLENDDYMTQAGRGMAVNAPRWFNADDAPPAPFYHPILATLELGSFAQDETAASIKAAMDLGGDVYVRPKVVVRPGTTHNGTTRYKATFTDASGNDVFAWFEIRDGMTGRLGADDFEEIVFLNDELVIHSDDEALPWAGFLLVTECTGIEVLEGNDQNQIRVVADCPARVQSATMIANRENTPVSMVYGPVIRDPDLDCDPAGVRWRIYDDDGDCPVHSRDTDEEDGWEEQGTPFDGRVEGPPRKRYRRPRIVCAKDGTGEILVCAEEDGRTHFRRARTRKADGLPKWERVV